MKFSQAKRRRRRNLRLFGSLIVLLIVAFFWGMNTANHANGPMTDGEQARAQARSMQSP